MSGMKVLIVGYGNMGRQVESVLNQRNHTVVGRYDSQPGIGDTDQLTPELLASADTAIEFTLADAVLPHARAYAGAGLPAVVGTTGWDADRSAVEKLIRDHDGAYLWGSNFAVGAHIMFSLVEHAAKLINFLPDYDIFGYELHHTKKKDSPSGTAVTISDKILDNCERKTKLATQRMDRRIEPEELHFASVRGGSIPGIHTVLLDSAVDTVEIRHTARNRNGLALGAVMAAEWLLDKKGFFQVEDFIGDLFNKEAGDEL